MNDINSIIRNTPVNGVFVTPDQVEPVALGRDQRLKGSSFPLSLPCKAVKLHAPDSITISPCFLFRTLLDEGERTQLLARRTN